MKVVMFGLILSAALSLNLIGCGKIDRNVSLEDDDEGDANRMAISSNSSTNQLNNEFDDLNRKKKTIANLSEDIVAIQKRISEKCEKLEDRAEVFNDELYRRFPLLSGVVQNLEDAETQMKEHVTAENHHLETLSKKGGERYAIDRIGHSGGSVKDSVVAEKKVLSKARRVAVKLSRKAKRDIKESNFVSPAYETAVAAAAAAQQEIDRIDSSLGIFVAVKKANYYFNRAYELSKLPALDTELKDAEHAVELEESYLVDLRAARQKAWREIAALPTDDDLKPFDMPQQCE